MKCWSCHEDTMKLRRNKAFYKCPCGATENVGGASDTEHPRRKRRRAK